MHKNKYYADKRKKTTGKKKEERVNFSEKDNANRGEILYKKDAQSACLSTKHRERCPLCETTHRH